MEGLGLGGPCHNASPELSENQLSSQDQGRCCALILGIFQQGSRSHFESSSPRNVSQNRQKDKGQQGFVSEVKAIYRLEKQVYKRAEGVSRAEKNIREEK